LGLLQLILSGWRVEPFYLPVIGFKTMTLLMIILQLITPVVYYQVVLLGHVGAASDHASQLVGSYERQAAEEIRPELADMELQG